MLTFDKLTRDRNFADLMRVALKRLEKVYQTPVDLEFVVEISEENGRSHYQLNIVQCRPLE
ncbi:MAG: PEP/pyruvate-binding domain-containing protein [Chloroflexi bacterium]|nr:PEP/pyruvate-binding domain-containing protein [Chloroflexota bacterium]